MVSSSCYDNFKLIIYLFQRVGDENLNHSSYNGELKLDITTKLRFWLVQKGLTKLFYII